VEYWTLTVVRILGFFLVSGGGGDGLRLSPLGTSATNWPIVPPRMIDEYGAFGGLRIGRGNLAPVPLCPPQIPYDFTWDRTRAAALGNRRLTV
jgi:hypothetical protein